MLRPDDISDIDYRLAAQLLEISALLAPEAVNQRPPEFDVLRAQIHQSAEYGSSPWRTPRPLRRFDDSYNAQTLDAWFVPKLLVDPDEACFSEISVQGPQVISGMRGCGKTMLLRSLMFHARTAKHEEDATRPGADTQSIGDRLAADRFVGLYVSCNRLLDPLGKEGPLHLPEARLFVAFVREALRALRHLRDVDSSLLMPASARHVGRVLARYVRDVPTDLSDDAWALEQLTLKILGSLQRNENRHTLEADPSTAFVELAEAIRNCSTIWTASSTFFLLDDVSTRYLNEESIEQLVSRLFFQSDMCAFKMTTEHQTLQSVLRSPGLIQRAEPGRDYSIFHLGERVNEQMKLHRPGGRRSNFIRDILARRAEQYQDHPELAPHVLLGDTTLKSIAERIASSKSITKLSPTGGDGKPMYHGLRALTAVCVGDIGDVLSIYESMLRKYQDSEERSVPISAQIQHQTFQDYCAKRLYHVNHRDGRFKDYAIGFAQASRQLLRDSAGSSRLRQYSRIHVRLPTGDSEQQFQQLRELIDAGVFVLQGGASRTKTPDGDPNQQFVLRYRNLFGLSTYIGLADRDRFELNGDDLREWLSQPERCKEILIRNVGSTDEKSIEPEAPLDDDWTRQIEEADSVGSSQLPLIFANSQPDGETSYDATDRIDFLAKRTPLARELNSAELHEANPQSLVLGLGFEDRTLESTKNVLEVVVPDRAVLIRYPEPGHGVTIEELVTSSVDSVDVIDYSDLSQDNQPALPLGPTLVDITGLAKSVIFLTIRQALVRDGVVFVAHTQAEEHYPRNENIEPILNAEADADAWAVFQRLDEEVWLGEKGPYKFESLMLTDADESRRRYLLASASPKHQRLLSLVVERDFDCIDVFSPPAGTPRSEVARHGRAHRFIGCGVFPDDRSRFRRSPLSAE